jgi:hypothetical protein
VQLRAIYGKDCLITTPVKYGESLRQAEYLSRLLSLPLIDTITDHETVVAPDRTGESLRDRLLPATLQTERVERPPGMRSEVSENDGYATIVITGGKSMAGVFAALSKVARTCGLGPRLFSFKCAYARRRAAERDRCAVRRIALGPRR